MAALDEMLLGPALIAAEKVLPRDRRAIIDGFNARDGVDLRLFSRNSFRHHPNKILAL